ncbi:unnamed protein product [Colletotrichum noveboracense]|uniref:C2H2-type domain-containing protein n=1 Tax=Colletotrichum noveboracense TaxID=2664923 RepID=A0A9W4S7B0_9PEZI|nr:unnamed protein product [Colletotrichum noveboracense]
MASYTWSEANSPWQATTVSPAQRVGDGQLIKHLVGRYGMNALKSLIQESIASPVPAERNAAPDEPSSIPAAISSTGSADFGPWESQRVRHPPLISSTTGAAVSKGSRDGSKLPSRHIQGGDLSVATHTSATRRAGRIRVKQRLPETPTVGTSSANLKKSKRNGYFVCGLCGEEDIIKTCARKSDLKRHIEDFHYNDAQWFCRHHGCYMAFDSQGVYKVHLKQVHCDSLASVDVAKVKLCPQVVFACGFDGCLQVFEASDYTNASPTFKEYVRHLVEHFEQGASRGEWSYSTRMSNLLRQSQVQLAWNERTQSEALGTSLKWTPQTSNILRKRLECRHIGDIKLLVQYAFLLGTDPDSISRFREDFVTPVASTCRMHMTGQTPMQQVMESTQLAEESLSKVSNIPHFWATSAASQAMPTQAQLGWPPHPHQQAYYEFQALNVMASPDPTMAASLMYESRQGNIQ